MTTNTGVRLSAAACATLVAAGMLTMLASAASPKFYNDDPTWVERDTEDASGVKPVETDLGVDLAYNLIVGKGSAPVGRARNTNTIDEVPDSSWFTNRLGRLSLTPEDVAIGPDTTDGPDTGTWTVTSSKSDGVTPGFTIKDANGLLWFLKFDPRGSRGMSTGTEVTVTKLMWALGYHVPENHMAYMHREQLVVGDGATFTPAGGSKRPMRLADIDTLLKRTDREPDGSYRIVASKALPGKPVGRVRFHGVRPDDPNDIVRHEDRRELRGYGVFAAWLNHVDAKAINSLDTLITENGRSYVRHHLIDFGSSLGSGGVGPADYWAGAQYLLEPRAVGKQMMGLGFSIPKWHTEAFYEARSIGRLPKNNAGFNPTLWKPRVPNRAFLYARADDRFWAAQRLVALSTEMIRAAVQSGDFRDPVSEEFLVRALSERRNAIARAYLTAINPISDPAFDGSGHLTFRNAAVDADVARAPRGYRADWFTFDNATHATERIGETSGRTTSLDAPDGLPRTPGSFIKVQLSSIGGAEPSWETPVDAYFRLIDGTWRLIGFERLPA